MLDYAWIIPAIPAVSFVLILFFGKRMPRQGAEIGIAAVGASFVLSCVAAVQWIERVDDATGGTARARARSAAGCSPAQAGDARGGRRSRSSTRSPGGRTAASSSASAPRSTASP